MITNKNTMTIDITGYDCLQEFVINQITFNQFNDDLTGANPDKKIIGLAIESEKMYIIEFSEDDCTIIRELKILVNKAENDSLMETYDAMLGDFYRNNLVVMWAINSDRESIQEFVDKVIVGMTKTDLFYEQLFSINFC